jgi:uncharacterized delta-60 repeat protein
MILQPDGKIVVAGYAGVDPNRDFIIVRYNADGSLDPTFGSGGLVTTDFGYKDWIEDVAIQTDGKIVVAGTSQTGPHYGYFAIARYNNDGSLDTTFDGDGMVTTGFDDGWNDFGRAVAIQNDGKIVVVGEDGNIAETDLALARYNSDGSLDTTFSGDGKVITAIGSFYDVPFDVIIQPDGKIVLAGYAQKAYDVWDFALARYNSDGSLDASFGTGGKVVTNLVDPYEAFWGSALQPDGKILVVGFLGQSYQDMVLARYDPDGSPDASFGQNGIVVLTVGNPPECIRAIQLMPDGRFVVAGFSNNDFALLRFNGDGSPDNTFGDNGVVFIDVNGSQDWGLDLVIQPDGKLVVAGYSFDGSNYDSAVARYQPDGVPEITLTASIGTVVDNGDETWSWSFATSDGPAESQTVTIFADDGNGGIAQGSFNLTVSNVPPTVNTITVPLDPVALNDQLVSASATFSDPAGSNDEPYTCLVNYGDGTGDQAGTVTGTTCDGPDHTYAEPGVYAVSVAVTDGDLETGSTTSVDFIVIYDPDGGFVTGGGWIDSPEGACPDFCGGAIGKANFGFVSKYKKGASEPTGQTEFQFKAGDLDFHSSSYDWLVIAGAKAMYKGTGTINGTGSYTFQINAIDGQVNDGGGVDKFRIKIWDKAIDEVVYDNQMGAAEDANPMTEIGGGSIVVHKAK